MMLLGFPSCIECAEDNSLATLTWPQKPNKTNRVSGVFFCLKVGASHDIKTVFQLCQ